MKRINPLSNYNPSIFLRVVSFILDIKYGGKRLNLEKKSPYYVQGINHAQSIEYDEIYQILKLYKLTETDVFVDVGCGCGRVFNYLLFKGFKGQMYGIEIDPEIALFTKNRLRKTSVNIICGNALELLPSNATVLFLFNPFNSEEMMNDFIDILESVYSSIKIIYFYPKFKQCFENRKFWKIETVIIKSQARNHNIRCMFNFYEKE